MEIIKRMNQKNKISIIVPVYNVQNELRRCVQSILAQTHKELEIILVNDGSSDASLEIMSELATEDQRIVIINKENGGVTSARLEGVSVATGDYIGFVDGDDVIEPCMYEFLLCNAIQYKADISHCGYQMIFSDGRANYFYNTGRIVEQDRITGIKDLLEGAFVEPGLCNKLFRKELLDRLCQKRLMPNDIIINEDLLMNYYLFNMADRSVYEDKCLYHYIVRSTSVSRQKMNYHKIYDPIKVKKIIMENSRNDVLEVARRVYVRTCLNVYNGLILERNSMEHIKEKSDIRKIIQDSEEWHKLLTKKQYVLVRMICKIPNLYSFIYKVYGNCFLRSKYN